LEPNVQISSATSAAVLCDLCVQVLFLVGVKTAKRGAR
jgi:hypothetical protein